MKWQSKALFSILFLFSLLIVSPSVQAHGTPLWTFVGPAPTNGDIMPGTNLTINLTTNLTINASSVTFEWFNETGIGTNYTGSVSVVNGSVNYTFRSFSGLNDGAHRFRINLSTFGPTNVTAQNLSVLTAYRNITIDTTKPTITISYPVNGTRYSDHKSTDDITVIVADTNLDKCRYAFAWGANTTFTCSSTTFTVAEGDRTLSVHVNDSANNVQGLYINFYHEAPASGGGGGGGAAPALIPKKTTPGVSVGTPTAPPGQAIREAKPFRIPVLHDIWDAITNFFKGTPANQQAQQQSQPGQGFKLPTLKFPELKFPKLGG